MTKRDDETAIGRRSFLKRASVAGAAAVLTPSLASAEAPVPTPDQQPSLVNPEKPVPENISADEIKTLLKLEPSGTCDFVRESYQSALQVAPGGLPSPFDKGHPLGSACYFMVTPEAPLKLHRIKSDRLYHYYLGDPIEVLLLHDGGTSELVVVGPNLPGGELVQLLVPGNTFHTARVTGKKRWFLGASSEWPALVESEDVEMGNIEALAVQYPEAAADLRTFPLPAKPKG